MQTKLLASVILMSVVGALGAAADETVTLSGMHICCGSCVEGINDTVGKVSGVTANPSEDTKTVVLTAADKPTLQKAVDALVAAGFYGTSSDSGIKVSEVSGATATPVQSLQITGVHLCCGKCVKQLDAVVTKVPGVTGCDASPNAAVFTVSGNFKPTDVFTAMNGAGFSGKVVPAAASAPAPGK